MVRASNDFAFVMRVGTYNIPATKRIVDSGVSQHITPHKYFFYTYESISGRTVFMGDNGMVEAVGKCFILP
jgi:hypothetical protein